MGLSIYSVVMAVIWSTVFIVIAYAFRRNSRFISGFGILALLLLFVGCALRIFLPIEFPFVEIISLEAIYTSLSNALYSELLGMNILNWLLIIWGAGTIISFAIFSCRYLLFASKLKRVRSEKSEQLERISQQMDMPKNMRVVSSDEIEFPMIAGFFHPIIYLNKAERSDEGLEYVLLHEIAHFSNRDLWIKLLIQIFCSLFWWNPFVYLLKLDLGHTLEIKCDLAVAKKLKEDERVDYLETVLSEMKKSSSMKPIPYVTGEFANDASSKRMKQRFELVLAYDDNKPRQKLFTTLFIIALIAVFLFSYSFIFQPKFNPPESDFATQGQGYEVTVQDGYILRHKDGTHSLVWFNGEVTAIENDFVEILANDGFNIIDE